MLEAENLMSPHYQSRSGCFKKVFFGCSGLFFVFFVIIILIIVSAEIPEIDFSFFETNKNSYRIDTDSTTNEKVINSSFSWSFVDSKMKRRKYELAFKLLEREVKEAMDYIDLLAKMSYEDLGIKFNQRYIDPETESEVIWAEVYRRVYFQSFPKMKPIMEGINKIFINEKYSNRDKAIFVISFVQNIHYDRPGGALDLFPPLGTLAYKFGDCDSKTLLLYVLLEKMNVDCAMFWSSYYKHAMLGVAGSGSGDYKICNGKKYYFLETTYPGWEIGDLPPDFNKIRFWYLQEIDSENYNPFSEDDNKNIDDDNSSQRNDNKPSPSKPK